MEAKIYKSDWRGCLKSNTYNCFLTFSSGDYQDLNRNPFGDLQVFNDETLAPKATILHQVERDSQILLVPMVGGIDFECIQENGFVHIHQAQAFNLKKGQPFKIKNPYETAFVRYFQLQFEQNSDTNSFQKDFDLTTRNMLLPLFENEKNKVFIGIYDGRAEETYTLNQAENGIFTFIIQGAFEFQNRLLETGDGLHLLGIEAVEFESLSENAILLVLEVSM